MPILLDTPWNPGDADPGQTYPRAKITKFSIEPDRIISGSMSGSIVVDIQYGDNLSGSSGSWSRGDASPGYGWMITGSDYDALVSVTGSSDSIYNDAKASLYNWLLDNNHLSGTIE